MDSMMHDVMRYGTGARAMVLGAPGSRRQERHHHDYIDAWFSGYQPTLVSIAWVGLRSAEKTRPRGDRVGHGSAIWMNYMAKG